MSIAPSPFPDLVEQARSMASGPRRVLGIAGPPGGGKSTLAQALVDALPGLAVLVPMDGFHLADAELVRLGRRSRKGAPDTFDADGYVALLQRLRTPGPRPVYCPVFDRNLEEPVAGAIAVEADLPLVVTEGNYLLLQDGPWAQVAPLLDRSWYVHTPAELRLERLVARHVRFGKSPEEARAWVLGSDERNAALIEPTAASADLVVDVGGTDLTAAGSLPD